MVEIDSWDITLIIVMTFLIAGLVKMTARLYSQKVNEYIETLKQKGIKGVYRIGLWLFLIPIALLLLYDTFQTQALGIFIAFVVYLLPWNLTISPEIAQFIIALIGLTILLVFGRKIYRIIKKQGVESLSHPFVPASVQRMSHLIRHYRQSEPVIPDEIITMIQQGHLEVEEEPSWSPLPILKKFKRQREVLD